MRMGSQTLRLAYDLQHLFLKTMILEAGTGPSKRVFSGWTLGWQVTNPCKPLVFNHQELTLSFSKPYLSAFPHLSMIYLEASAQRGDSKSQ